MRRLVSICSLVALSFGMVCWLGCTGRQSLSKERKETDYAQGSHNRRFDPLDLPQDMEVVPQQYPQGGEISGVVVQPVTEGVAGDTSYPKTTELLNTVDTLIHQAYRIQLFTSKLFGEASRALKVAQEIFDRPVFLDYEVPYYKVRVGSFVAKEDAEDYLQKAKAAGYPDAWVVVVNVGIKETAPLYPERAHPTGEDSTDTRGTRRLDD